MFNVLGISWGPTDKVLFVQIHLVKSILVLLMLTDRVCCFAVCFHSCCEVHKRCAHNSTCARGMQHLCVISIA